MPHISRHKLKDKTKQEIEEKLMLFLSTTTVSTRQDIFSELFTQTERLMIAKRLAVLFLITEGLPTHSISERLRVSPSTVARFENASTRGHFTKTKAWLTQSKDAHKVIRYIAELVSVPFDSKRKSLGKIIEENI